MRVYNKSKRKYQHDDYTLVPGANLKVSDEVAKLWLATGEVVEYVAPEEAKKAEEKAQAKQKALEDENVKLKAEIEKLKKAKKAEEK